MTRIKEWNPVIFMYFLTMILLLIGILQNITLMEAKAETVKSGTMGENLTWQYSSDGTLTISGNGSMPDYTTEANYYTGITTDVPWANYLEDITKIVVSGNIDNVGKCAFSDCVSIKQVSLPGSIKKIGEAAFARCTGLENIQLPSKLVSIGNDAFRGCSGITNMIVPDNVTTIGSGAFQACTNMVAVSLGKKISSIQSYTFTSCTKLSDIEIPQSVTSIGMNAFSLCNSISEVNIPESVQSISFEAFSSCPLLKKVTINNDFLAFDRGIFENCSDHFTLYGNSGSTAQTYAENNGHAFIAMSSGGTVRKKIVLCEAFIPNAVYTGKPQMPQVSVTDGDIVLKKDIDYTVTFSHNTEAGTARAEIIGIGRYAGTIVKEFLIGKATQTIKASLSSVSIRAGESAQITADGVGTVSYISDNIDIAAVNAQGRVTGISPGVAKITVTIAGDANHNPGSKVLSITVTEKTEGALDHGGGTGSGAGGSGNGGSSGSEKNTGNAGVPGTSGNSGGSSATGPGQGTNFPSVITNQTKSQKITAFSKTVVYKSKPFSLKAKASGGGKLTYKSSNKKVAVVSAKGKVTVKNYGKTQITIKAAAEKNYKETTMKITVKVVPRTPIFANAKRLKIKADKTVSGYEVYLCTNKKFKKNVRKGRFEKNDHGMRMGRLKKNVNYFMKARSYKKVGEKIYYSAWSKVIRVKK